MSSRWHETRRIQERGEEKNAANDALAGGAPCHGVLKQQGYYYWLYTISFWKSMKLTCCGRKTIIPSGFETLTGFA